MTTTTALEVRAEIPEPPPGMLAATRAQWADFWTADVAKLVTSGDLPALRRLFSLYDERARLHTAGKRQRLVTGSTGQPVLNPSTWCLLRSDAWGIYRAFLISKFAGALDPLHDHAITNYTGALYLLSNGKERNQ